MPYVICELLLAFGAIPDSVDQNGFSPLHIAAINDRDDIMDMIINAENHGVVTDIDAKSHEGRFWFDFLTDLRMDRQPDIVSMKSPIRD